MSTAGTCWRKFYNEVILQRTTGRNWNLVMGNAVHMGAAVGFATRDWTKADEVTQQHIDEEIERRSVDSLPQEMAGFQTYKDICKEIISQLQDSYAKQPYDVISPEVSFDEELKDIQVFDWAKVDWDPTRVEEVKQYPMIHPRVAGFSDGIINWGNRIYILEIKTSSQKGEMFWAGIRISAQTKIYKWAIEQALGIKLDGVIINLIYKPSESMVNSWNKRRKHGPDKKASEYISIESEPIMLEDVQCESALNSIKQTMLEWDWRMTTNNFKRELTPLACGAYHQKCAFYDMCIDPSIEQELLNDMPSIDLGPERMPIEIQEGKGADIEKAKNH